jgi:pimeloyl-ACP methyl ester carboxylesterase
VSQAPEPSVRDTPWAPTHRPGRVLAADGVGLHYDVVGAGPHTVVLANGLGGRLYSWRPLVTALWERYRFITWDYRGLFESDSPRSLRRLALAHHVEDARAILDAEGVARAAFVGWSMGVQVALEFAAAEPGRVAGLALVNGTYGHVLSHGFQPIFSLPGLPPRLHAILEFLRDHPSLAGWLARLARTTEIPTMGIFLLTAGRRVKELRPMLRQYFADVLGPSFTTYLRLFQELDAHSAYHLLREIDTPTLIVSGALDPLTPARQSLQMARRMPRARHLRLWRAGHFALLARPDVVVPAIARFLAGEAGW